jgi:hypothetical protein
MRNRVSNLVCLTGLLASLLSACRTSPIDAIGMAPGGLSAGLVAHWTFDEGTGTVVHDTSGKLPHDGAIGGSTWSWLPQGRFGSALHLEQGDYVAVDNFPNATPDWTVSAWVQIAAKDVNMSEATVISTEDVFHGGWEMNINQPSDTAPGPNYHFAYWTGPGNYTYAFFTCSGCILADQWQHLTAVVDGGVDGALDGGAGGVGATLSFYLDGVLQNQQQVPRTILPGTPTLYMGRWPTTDPPRLMVGSIDDIAIWSRALASEEIRALGRAPVPTPLP